MLPHEKKRRKLGAIGQPDGPTPEEIEERRKPQFFIDPKEVSANDDARVRKWSHSKMIVHESKFTRDRKENQIIASGDVEPEDLDIRSIYNFDDMHWIIFRRDGILYRGGPKEMLFHIVLIARIPRERGGSPNHSILFQTSFASI